MNWRKAMAATLGAIAFGASAADTKIGFVNTERVFREAAPARRAQQKLEREFSARNVELAKLEKQGRDLQAELEKDSVTLPDAARRRSPVHKPDPERCAEPDQPARRQGRRRRRHNRRTGRRHERNHGRAGAHWCSSHRHAGDTVHHLASDPAGGAVVTIASSASSGG